MEYKEKAAGEIPLGTIVGTRSCNVSYAAPPRPVGFWP